MSRNAKFRAPTGQHYFHVTEMCASEHCQWKSSMVILQPIASTITSFNWESLWLTKWQLSVVQNYWWNAISS